MSADEGETHPRRFAVKRDHDETVGSTLPDPNPAASGNPRLATFDRPADRFQLGEELGRGGMGRVVAATDLSLARSVAIKQVLSEHPDDLVRFEREVRITAELEHPSIVPIHEAARGADGRPYYVMRRIEGDPLSARLSATTLRARLALLPNLLAVVDAAAFAHARNIIHRDIKPSNILLGAYGETHLIDWGLARRLDDLDVSGPRTPQSEQLTQAGHIYGTVGYMAPEQARGEHVDTRADVYALGATLFHVIAGHAPFAHMSDVERLSAAVTGEDRPPLDKLADEVPPELVAIVEKAMARAREDRYQHAGELAADLRAFLGGKLVGAHHYTTGERLRRFVRRHRFAVALTVISLITVAVITAVALRRIIAGKADAEDARNDAMRERGVAMARADLLLIERASSIAATEPSRAAALLLDLPLDTSHHARARDAIAKVAASGLSRGAATHTKQVNGLAFSPDGKTLASVAIDGLVVTYDVATGRSSTIVDLHTALYNVEWIDATTVMVSGYELGGNRLIDVRTRATRTLPTADVTTWWRDGDRVRYFDLQAQTISEVSLSGGGPRALVRDVIAAVGQRDLAVYATATGVFVLEGTTPRRLGDPTAVAPSLAIARDGKHVAGATSTETIEWEVATGKEHQRWRSGSLLGLMYGPSELIVTGPDNQLIVLHPGGRIARHAIRRAPLWSSRIASGIVLAFDDGQLLVLDRTGFHSLDHAQVGSRVVTSLPDRMLVATGSRDGSVRWLDLSTVTPHPISLDGKVGACTATARHIYVVDVDEVVEIEIATHRTRMFDGVKSDFGVGAHCSPQFGNHILAVSPLGLLILEPARGAVDTIQQGAFPAIDGDRAIYAVGAEIFELLPDESRARSIYKARATVEGLALLGDRIVMQLAGSGLVRLDRTSGATVELPLEEAIQSFGLLPDGSVWFVHRAQLVSWDGAGTRPIAVFDHPIRFAIHTRGHYFVTLSDGSVWNAGNGVPQQHLPAGIRPLAFGSNAIAVGLTPQRVTTHYLLTGEVVTRDFTSVNTALPILGGRGLLVRAGTFAILYRDEVPAAFPEAKAWLENATNARSRPGTGALYWK